MYQLMLGSTPTHQLQKKNKIGKQVKQSEQQMFGGKTC